MLALLCPLRVLWLSSTVYGLQASKLRMAMGKPEVHIATCTGQTDFERRDLYPSPRLPDSILRCKSDIGMRIWTLRSQQGGWRGLPAMGDSDTGPSQPRQAPLRACSAAADPERTLRAAFRITIVMHWPASSHAFMRPHEDGTGPSECTQVAAHLQGPGLPDDTNDKDSIIKFYAMANAREFASPRRP